MTRRTERALARQLLKLDPKALQAALGSAAKGEAGKQLKAMAVKVAALAESARETLEAVKPTRFPVKAPRLYPGVIPNARAIKRGFVCDGMPVEFHAYDSQHFRQTFNYANQYLSGLGFPGYAYLAQLNQRSEYRAPSETMATEMTRKWVKLKSKAGRDLGDKISKLQDAMKRFGIRALFERLAAHDGYYGRAQLHISIKGQEDDENQKLPLLYDPASIAQGSLLGFKCIEAVWTAPLAYNTTDPRQPDFYKPRAWFVLGKQTHASRLLTIISREVSDILKPAYNFAGLSMTQLMEPYVNQWLRTRDSISDLIHNFSILYLATNMAATLEGDQNEPGQLLNRAQLFANHRDNKNLMLIDKDKEELGQLAVPLSGLEGLQAQAQEHMAAPAKIPLVKLLGITPTGLNASADGEIQVFYDYVSAAQVSVFDPALEVVLTILQLNEFGAVDEDITHEWVPLEEMSEPEKATVRKADTDRDVALVAANVVSPDEVRERMQRDPSSGYDHLSGSAPEPLPEDDEGLDKGAGGGSDDD